MNGQIQLGKKQIAIISNTIYMSHEPKVLVFGLGYDSWLWYKVTRQARGQICFLETDKRWIETITKQHPELKEHVFHYTLSDVSVEKSLALLEEFQNNGIEDIEKHFPIPAPEVSMIKNCQEVKKPITEFHNWGVILIDGPSGYGMKKPGRVYPLLWTKKILEKTLVTHVFVDDYSRKLERGYVKLLFKDIFEDEPIELIDKSHLNGRNLKMAWFWEEMYRLPEPSIQIGVEALRNAPDYCGEIL